MMMPSHVRKIKKYRGKIPLFTQEKLSKNLIKYLTTEIKLNLRYLAINPTEALVSLYNLVAQ